MQDYGPQTFGDRIATYYDKHYQLETTPTAEKIGVLADLAAGGPVLDVGCGTGLMAIALAERGLDVMAVDSSPKMLDQLRKNDPGHSVQSGLVDVTRDTIEGSYSLAYALFETLIMVGDRRAQQATLENIARSLRPGGKLVVEISVFDLDSFAELIGNTARVMSMSPDHVGVGFSMYDRDSGRLDYQDVMITEEGIRLFPIVMYPSSPQQLTTMAQGAGLRKHAHWSDWTGEKYRTRAPSLVAVYERP